VPSLTRGSAPDVSPRATTHNHRPSLAVLAATEPRRCRCGARIAPGERVIVVTGLPSVAVDFFRDRAYCSARCVHADFLESFETFDAMVATADGWMVSDLHSVYGAVRRAFAALVDDGRFSG
jgi:hypothetical protein